LGLGDDQDADGYLMGFEKWEKDVWEYLGVAGDAGAATTITDDQNKINSNFLRGTIAQGLADTSTGALAELDTKITKFHGIYQQDDRDLRDARKSQGLEKAYSFMVRLRIPGGIVTPSQYLDLDGISDQFASSTIRLTTRQTIQYHGIIKKNLRAAMQAINKTLLDTIAACGDVNRNVLCTSNPGLAPSVGIHQELVELATNWSLHMLPKTGAYREIWLDDKLVKGGDTVKDFEPIYGPTYQSYYV
jgi:sulfite reductase (NADPH) hemoprotein beta-component